MKKPRQIAKVVTKIKIWEKQSDVRFWQTQPPQARITALEEIRWQYHGWTDETYPRLQRIFTIVKRS